MHQQILLARIGWGGRYEGEDLTGNFREPNKSRSWWERFNFTRGPGDVCYGYVPPLGKQSSPPNPKQKQGWLIVFCSKQHASEPLWPVGWYEEATFEDDYLARPPNPSLDPSRKALWKKIEYKVRVKATNAYLIPEANRRLFPDVPTTRFRRSYIYARSDGKDRYIDLVDIAERIKSFKKNAECVGDIEPTPSAKERSTLLKSLFDKQVKEMQASEGITSTEARKRVVASILERPGQVRFRKSLLRAYGGTCVISDCDCADALEAAHIQPYADGGKDHITNGLLLRADLHKLLDLGKIRIHPETHKVVVSDDLKKTVYQSLNGTPLKPPMNPAHKPKIPG